MEYSPLEKMQHYADCSPLVTALGFHLVELRVLPRKGGFNVRTVIQVADATGVIGINECAKVHRVLLQRLEAILGCQDISMEVTSPGTERQIKNAAEFALFTGRPVRVWDRTLSDWVSGIIAGASEDALLLEDKLTVRSIPYENIAKAKLV
jgi:ribosome maturation factor RimP